MRRLLELALLVGTGLMGLSSVAIAQDDLPTFRKYPTDNSQRIGVISRLSSERRKALMGFIDAADTPGFFAEDVEARGAVEYGVVLYLLGNWEEAEQLPPRVMPPVVLEQLRDLTPETFRYAIPLRRPDGHEFAAVLYTIGQYDDTRLSCLAEDLVLLLESEFTEGIRADCISLGLKN